MSSNRWLLPDGVEEVLPSRARSIEALRRQILDLYHNRGYELVMPPLIEYTDSLLVGLGSDMDLYSFKMADQLSGKMLAVRPDMTPQVARIDAHSLARDCVTRYCYAGSVLHTVPLGTSASRSPFQVGAELYGEASVDADIEIIALMLDTVRLVSDERICLDLGHVGVFTALVKATGLQGAAKDAVFDALQRKSESDLHLALAGSGIASSHSEAFVSLLAMNGGIDVLERLNTVFKALNIDVSEQLGECRQVFDAICAQFTNVDVFFDFTELRGYHYHTGLVFAALVDGFGEAIANGGRYDDIGEVFGRPRPATGFSSSIDRLSQKLSLAQEQRVYVAHALLADAAEEIARLRAEGIAVVTGFVNGTHPENCTHELAQDTQAWVLKAL